MAIQSIRGMRDLYGPEAATFQWIEREARDVFRLYGFTEIVTPVLEETVLFARGIGEGTEVVQKQMYTFADKKDRSLALRPEGTASVVRAVLQHGLLKQRPVWKLFYIGPMFRYEQPQKGRYRQFFQIGAEIIGSPAPAGDVELMEWLVRFLRRLGFAETELLLNSVGCPACRPAYLQELAGALASRTERICRDCQERAGTNPLRVFDCKQAPCRAQYRDLPRPLDHLCADCQDHFSRVQALLEAGELPFTVAPHLVRGLDYYTRTAFEIVDTGLGAQNALLGGGRYDGLVELLGGPATPAVGFAIGVDRLALVCQERGTAPPPEPVRVQVCPLGAEQLPAGAALVRALRDGGIPAAMGYEARSLKAQLRHADRGQVPFACILGEAEAAAGTVQVKALTGAGEAQETVPQTDLAAYLQRRLALMEKETP